MSSDYITDEAIGEMNDLIITGQQLSQNIKGLMASEEIEAKRHAVESLNKSCLALANAINDIRGKNSYIDEISYPTLCRLQVAIIKEVGTMWRRFKEASSPDAEYRTNDEEREDEPAMKTLGSDVSGALSTIKATASLAFESVVSS